MPLDESREIYSSALNRTLRVHDARDEFARLSRPSDDKEKMRVFLEHKRLIRSHPCDYVQRKQALALIDRLLRNFHASQGG